MSLFLLNEDAAIEASYQRLLNQSPGAARVLTAAAQWYGDGVLPDLYTALGQAMFTQQNREIVHNSRLRAEEWAAAMREAIGKALAETGLAAELAEVANSTAYDDALRAQQKAAMSRVGNDVGTPVIHLDGTGIFGPVLTSIPQGTTAVRLFEAVRLLAGHPHFFELKRTLTGELNLN